MSGGGGGGGGRGGGGGGGGSGGSVAGMRSLVARACPLQLRFPPYGPVSVFVESMYDGHGGGFFISILTQDIRYFSPSRQTLVMCSREGGGERERGGGECTIALGKVNSCYW